MEPSPQKVALLHLAGSVLDGETVQVGDRVEVRSRSGWLEARIVTVLPKRGGKVDLSFSTAEGRDLKWTAPNGYYKFLTRDLRYLGPGNADPGQDEEMSRALDRKEHREEVKEDLVQKGRDALEKWDLKPGDRVIIHYTNGDLPETVNGVNWNTGKVGIVRQKRRTPEEEQELRDSFALMNHLTGRNIRPPLERDTRWIPAQLVDRILERFRA